ncbi:MAG: leucine-rich repeat domain-containing protein [Alphaproteobacteria bacterium]|nr:leucine-rich repeat domain-containing protein [Alphaproteobacteria bacterium]
MKKLILMGFLTISFSVRAQIITGDTCGNDCSWRLENGVLTVTGSGRIKGYNRDCTNSEITGRCTTDAPWFDYAENIEKVVIQNKSDTETFDTIGTHAFEDMFYTKEIILPEGIKTIEDEAFHLNKALETINLPNSLETIGSWALSSGNLSEINIPASVTTIGYAAFDGEKNITTLILPEGLETLNVRICSVCQNLTTVVLPENVSIGYEEAFVGTPLLSHVYCAKNNQSLCVQILSDSDKTEEEIAKILKQYDKQGGVYILEDGTKFLSAADMAGGTNECKKELGECKRDVLESKGICQGSACDTFIQSDGNYMLKFGGKTYQDINALLKGNYDRRRIYTIEEANFVAGTKNRVSITYR